MELLSFQNFRLEGRVAFVTGAAQGMGIAISKVLAMNGARVAMCDLNRTPLAKNHAAMLAKG